MNNQPSLRESLKNGLEFFFIAVAALGLSVVFASITTGIIDWIPFMVALPVLWVLIFCLLQLKSFFYRSILLPGGAVIASLILAWLLLGKPGMNYFEKNNTFLFVQLNRGLEAKKTELGYGLTGTGKSSKAKRDLLDGMSYYEDKKLRADVDALLKDYKFKEASELVAKWEAQHQEVVKNLKGIKKDKEATSTLNDRVPLSTGQIVLPPKGESQEYYTELGYTARWSNDSDFKIKFENGVEVGPSEHTNLSLPYRFINRSDKEIIIRTNVSKA